LENHLISKTKKKDTKTFYMRSKKDHEKPLLKRKLTTKVEEEKYQELYNILSKNPNENMSSLVRKILHNRPVTIYTRDLTLDNTMEELARLRGEIRAIGVNINQITRLFNTYPEEKRKHFYAKMAFAEYLNIEPKIDHSLCIISKLAKRWLSA
jgi:MobC-like protein